MRAQHEVSGKTLSKGRRVLGLHHSCSPCSRPTALVSRSLWQLGNKWLSPSCRVDEPWGEDRGDRGTGTSLLQEAL